MDPPAAWDQLLAAYAAGDWEILEERATDLLAWLDRGGFPPTIIRQPDLDPDRNRVLTRAGCVHALETIQSTWSIKARALPRKN